MYMSIAEDKARSSHVFCPACNAEIGEPCFKSSNIGNHIGRLFAARNFESEIKMARGRKAGAAAKVTQGESLLKALDFVSCANIKSGFDHAFEKHVVLFQNAAYATNGILQASFPIEESLSCIPHLAKLQTAVKRCGTSLTITERENKDLIVKGDKIRAIVECIDFQDVPPPSPDPNIAVISDDIKTAFKAVLHIPNEAGDRVFETAVLLEANSLTATDGKVCVQYWHGVDLPPSLVLSKSFMQAICKQTLSLIGFGFSDNSVTFYFEGGGWIKTLRYADKYPDCNKFFEDNFFVKELPPGLFEAIAIVEEYDEDGVVTFGDNCVMTGDTDKTGFQVEVQGLQEGKQFKHEILNKIKNLALLVDYTTYSDRLFFTGDCVRGVAMALSSASKPYSPPVEEPKTNDGWTTAVSTFDIDDEIPY